MDKELKQLIQELVEENKSLKKEISEIKKNQELTHKNQEKLFKNQVDMENKLEQIKTFEKAEAQELKDLEEYQDKEEFEEEYDGVMTSFLTKVIDNFKAKLNEDKDKNMINERDEKVLNFMFSRHLYDAYNKKFNAINFNAIRKGAGVDTNSLKDVLTKLIEEKYLVEDLYTRADGQKTIDSNRKVYHANYNYFKH